ncbi:hypothetical protein KOW79_011229 [Hemibagrus wyckioides]|uniref:Uncharacterized protein n=1 Tax=Hemibagrus wyckioides TaxID=337641 RepID=A0A9D3NPD8_9TELE|nr:hypothetical protein KOW79_011229 [Hemibagrus wyckioides]
MLVNMQASFHSYHKKTSTLNLGIKPLHDMITFKFISISLYFYSEFRLVIAGTLAVVLPVLESSLEIPSTWDVLSVNTHESGKPLLSETSCLVALAPFSGF